MPGRGLGMVAAFAALAGCGAWRSVVQPLAVCLWPSFALWPQRSPLASWGHPAFPPGTPCRQQAGQGAMHRRQRLAQDQGQFPRVDEGHEAKVMQQLLVGDAHVSSVADVRPGGHQASVSTGAGNGSGPCSLGPGSICLSCLSENRRAV